MMAIVNLYRKQAMQIFPELRFVKFRFYEDRPQQPGNVHWASMGYYNQWQVEQGRLARELRQFMKEAGISYGWPNSLSVDYSSLITLVIVNPADYAMLKLMSDEYEITNTYMIPDSMPSFSFRLTEEDYEKHKDAISQIKR